MPRKPRVHHWIEWREHGTLVQGAACLDPRAKALSSDIQLVVCKKCITLYAVVFFKLHGKKILRPMRTD